MIREEYPDCLLFFRLGDFYELFLDDAELGARVLGITLTRRPRGKDGDIPMAGVPYHSAETYVAKLVKLGYKIAICEQVTEPDGKGLVDRKVVRIITPGTVLADASLEQKKQNYVCSICWSKKKIGYAAVDITTGECVITEFERTQYDTEQLSTQFVQTKPNECIVSPTAYNDPTLLGSINKQLSCNIAAFPNWERAAEHASEIVCSRYAVRTPESLGIVTAEVLEALAALLSYLDYTQQMKVEHVRLPQRYSPTETMILDPVTVENLELFAPLRGSDSNYSLLSILDRTEAAGGGRLLNSWLARPLRNKNSIEARQEVVAALIENVSLRAQLKKHLSHCFDIERIIAKIGLRIAPAAVLSNLLITLREVLRVRALFKEAEPVLLKRWNEVDITSVEKLVNTIAATLQQVQGQDQDQSKATIAAGVSSQLDSVRATERKIQAWVEQYEAEQKKVTGIATLKCRYNQVVGYYIEVSKSYTHLAPATYQRKQTLVNGERFTTPELSQQEHLLLAAEAEVAVLEREILSELFTQVLTHKEELLVLASLSSELDCLVSFAQVAAEKRYVRPRITQGSEIKIKQGKHPVVESLLHEQFVPNDVELSAEQQLLLITGPNMAGKSVFMR